MSATPGSTLADLRQIIAEVQQQLAECRAERDEALQRENATAEVLRVINSSPGDLTPVFDAILEKAHSLCGVQHGVLLTYDGELFWPVAMRGAPATLEKRNGFRPSSGFAGLVRGEQLLHIRDMAEFAEQRPDEPIYRELLENGGIRTQLAVPLRKDRKLLGIITVNRGEVRPFSEKQIALLQNFAAQAVIAMENARLLTETREALEQQTATAELLQVINSSPGDLAPVFDEILEKAHTLCGAEHGALVAYEGEQFSALAMRAMPEPFAGFLRQPFRPYPGGVQEGLLQGERLVHIPDVAARELAAPLPIQKAALEAGIRTLLMVPLRKDRTLLGYITAHRREVRPFTDKQVALLQNFAAQAVIAMENARLLTETREALEQQTATADVLGVINSSPGDLTPVFDAMLEKATELCEAAFGVLRTWDGERFHFAAAFGNSQLAEWARNRPAFTPERASILGRIVGGESIVTTVDAARDQTSPGFREMAEVSGMRSAVTVALRKDAILVGSLTVYRQEVRPFTDKQIALLKNFAAQAVIAIENAQLITETREALEKQTATAEVLQVINSSPGDLAPVFESMLEKAIRLCSGIQGALWTVEGDRARLAASYGNTPAFVAILREHERGVPDPPEAVRETMRGGCVLNIRDLVEHELYRQGDPVTKGAVELSGVRSLVGIPLVRDRTSVGAFMIGRREVRVFSEKEIALLRNFAAQAVIAMENARLITETREALERQTAIAEVLQVINSSPGNLAPVFETILEKAHTLCGATYGGLVIRDTDGFRVAAARGDAGFVERWRQLRPLHPPQGSPLARLMLGEKVIHLADAPADDNYRNTTPPELQRLGEFGGLRTLLMVPLRTDHAFLGVITAFRLRVQPFTDKEVALLENFAAQAVIAMENARLLGELRQRTDEVAELNRGLEAQVAEQVEELGRVARLKRFLAPQVAELIVSQGDEKILESHRRDIVVVFCDLRGYTAFTETAEPEEVLDFLGEYHGALGPLVSQFEGTLDQFSGDGIMVFFNDPVPCANPAERAVKMAMAMRDTAGTLIAAWRRRGRVLGFGAGIAQGYATLGQIGFADRSGYTAIGTVCNLAARLCAEAKDGQILVAQRVAVAVEATMPLEDVGELTLKGLTQPVVAFNVPLVATQPALRVIDGGSPENV